MFIEARRDLLIGLNRQKKKINIQDINKSSCLRTIMRLHIWVT